MIIVDENISKDLIDFLSKNGYSLYSIREHQQGINDRMVIETVKLKNGFLITEDKDFGELIFSHGIRECSIIFLRYDKQDSEQIKQNLLISLNTYYQIKEHCFITITKNKIRVRKI